MKLLSVFDVLAVALVPAVAFPAVSLSEPALHSSSPGVATLSAAVAGTGDVFAEYAHAKKPQAARSVKSRYVQDGLIAMWDGVDNMGLGSHVANATTWRDLVGGHADMTFTATPTVGATYYDLSKGGCGTDAEDIGLSLNDGQTTVEIVCTVNSIKNDATLFACVDGTDTATGAAGNRFAWVRHQDTAIIGGLEYKWNVYYGQSPLIDTRLGTVRHYSFMFNHPTAPGDVVITTNGVYAATVTGMNMKGNAVNARFSLGQRICIAGNSTAISDMRVHCVRVYDRTLTDAERLANLAVDRERFESPSAIDLDNPGAAVSGRQFVGTVKEPIAGAKDYYEQSGLIAMWDGEDNQGTGAHVAGATTWADLTGNHAAMSFDTAPTVGTNYYDVKNGGGRITSCADIAQAVQAKNATIEIVCDVRTLVESGTLVSLVDGTDTGAGNRLVWIMNGASGSNHEGVLGTIDYLTASSTTPYPSYDQVTNAVRSYTMMFAGDKCSVYRNGAATAGTSKVIGNNGTVTSGNANTACFSIGQRYSQGGKSGTISDMKVYCVRVYDRQLTAAEVAANHAADVRRFFGAKNEQPLGSVEVVNPDGTSSYGTNGRGLFKLTGLRPDALTYTARLLTTNATPAVSPSVTFESAAEGPAAAWYEYADSRNLPDTRRAGAGPQIRLNYAAKGHVPSVEARYQILYREGSSGDGHGVFGAIDDTHGTYVMRLAQDSVSILRYRLDAAGGYAQLPPGALTNVQEIVFNGPSGTFLNGAMLDASLAGQADAGTLEWMLFGRHLVASGQNYWESGRVRVWYFRLFSDGEPVRDLVPVCGIDGTPSMFDRVSETYFGNWGSWKLCHGPELPCLALSNAVIECGRLTATLRRSGTAASDVYVAYGDAHGGARLADWAQSEKLSAGFSAGSDALSVELPASVSAARYVRFFSVADGWSESAFIPETRVRKGLTILVR